MKMKMVAAMSLAALLVAPGCSIIVKPNLIEDTQRQSETGAEPEGRDAAGPSFSSKKIKEAEEERRYRRDNVVISVKKLYEAEGHWWFFDIVAENQNEITKTVEGTICLYNMYIRPRECGIGDSAIKIVIPPKSTQQIKNMKFKGKIDVNSWAFIIHKIHNY